MAENPRIFTPKKPAKLIVGVVLIGIILVAFLIAAVFNMSSQIVESRMRGTVTAKNFTPGPEQQITVGKGGLNSREVKGQYEITVAVKQKDGSSKDYIVSNLGEKAYDAVKIGDPFDVGPYLQP
ncbi:MAG: hypothetical protein ABIP97_10575 [Chthoniobacterales bacterium]